MPGPRPRQAAAGYRQGVYRFLFSRRWLGGLALAVVVAIGCVLLGTWQWDRREQRLERNALVTGNYDLPPASLDDVLPEAASPLPPGTEYTPVALEGRYLADSGLLLRNRPLDGLPGYHSLVPFQTRDGDVVLVDRGWVPVGSTGAAPDDVPVPPAGEVEVTVRLRPGEGRSERAAPQGQLQRIDLAAVADLLGEQGEPAVQTGAYGVLASERPAPAAAPTPLPRPAIDEGPHLSYSLQWFVFALGALVGFVVLVRRTAGDQATSSEATGRPAVHSRRSRPSAEAEEDALLDAAERSVNRT